MLEQLRAKLRAKLDERAGAQRSIDEVLASADAEKRTELTADESAKFTEARSRLDAFDQAPADEVDSIANLRSRIADLEGMNQRRLDAEQIVVAPTPAGQGGTIVRVGQERRTYEPGNGNDFFSDAFRAKFGNDPEAWERIHRSKAEDAADGNEYRSTSGGYGTLVVPQYLTDLYAPVLRSGRPTITAIGVKPLDEAGMNFTIPRGNTGTLVSAQATENTAVTNQTLTETDLVVPVRTFGGLNNLSRQAFERGASIGDIIMQDLAASYATQVNVSVIKDDGSNGTHFGLLNTTGTLTAAWTGTTGASLVSSLHNAIGKINSARFMPASLIIMSPRRWAWLCAQSDGNGRPLVNIYGAQAGVNIIGEGQAAAYGNSVGDLAGIPIVTDAGVPVNLGASTDEDRIIVTRKEDLLFWEQPGAPRELNFQEVLGDQLTVRLVAYGYSMFTAGRYPVATCVLSGTGFKQVLT